jgi:hypothetical protein
MAEIIRVTHWTLRYLVFLAGVLAILVSVIQYRRTTASGSARISAAAFTGLIDLQILMGLFMLLTRPFYGALSGHIVMMIAAAGVAHMGSIRARRREPELAGAPLRVFAFTIALVLIVGGLLAINRPVL